MNLQRALRSRVLTIPIFRRIVVHNVNIVISHIMVFRYHKICLQNNAKPTQFVLQKDYAVQRSFKEKVEANLM